MTGARELRIDPNTNAEQITNQLCMRSEWTQVTALFIIAQKALQDTSEIGLKLDNDEDDEDDEDDHKGEEFENECLNVSGEDLNIQYTKTISSHIEMMF
ncbi:MAG: hypothetical protein EZS28_024824 [Streblomastix strix]|uniref:Uncharacterized protein n=1 Tax=Streblomastix strix TaxID=222440 RepID=A0A5J4VAX0_9EUKA|nr:MAG: hypothetical protein EZS28_024824 [Streblomastix strix]